jgi:NAD dependent epimerase/dehydratase family enzyme
MPWISLDDIAGIYLAALSDDRWSGPVNASAPSPVTNAGFTRALGRALKRPAVVPIPSLALRVLYGEMSSVMTAGQRTVPCRALEFGYEFRHAALDDALRAALS